MYNDCTLISQEGTRYPAHRSLLAARSDYFSKLLYGGLKEANEEEVKIMCADKILKTVLLFLYKGEFEVDENSDVEDLLNLLDETRLMCLNNMEAGLQDLIKAKLHFLYKGDVKVDEIEDVKTVMNLLSKAQSMHMDDLLFAFENFIIDKFINKQVSSGANEDIINILNIAVEKEFPEVTRVARIFLREDIDSILNSSQLLNKLSALGLQSLINEGDPDQDIPDLDIIEIDIFRGVISWLKNNINCEENGPINLKEKLAILSELRLELMTPKQLTTEVRPSGLFSDTEILDAIQKQQDVDNLNPREVIDNKNICLESMGAKVLNGVPTPWDEEISESISAISRPSRFSSYRPYQRPPLYNEAINGRSDSLSYDSNRGYTMCELGDRLEIQLPSRQAINKIKMLLYDRDGFGRGYSYQIESSLDGEEWDVIADYSESEAMSWQTIFFPKRRAQYIGITGVKEYLHEEKGENAVHKYDDTPRDHIHIVAIEAMLDTITEKQDRISIINKKR